ncbi:MAG: Ig-like domain-containing protein [Methanobacterium sp. ERen5]|nr:MAG: Ig-like domain-containing protein [Methanobacterium sp. ERen5]
MQNIRIITILLGFIMLITIILGSSSATVVKNPYITSLDPYQGSIDVPANSAINVIFNENVTLSKGLVELKSSSNYSVPISLTLKKQKLRITPNCLLKNGKKYTLYIHKGSFKDRENNFNKLFTSSFRVSSTPPTSSKVYFQVLSPEKTVNGTKTYSKYAVYQKPAYSTYWNRYLFYHIMNPAVNGINGPEDVYRIYKLQNILSNSNNILPISIQSTDLTTPGNWEKAVQISGNPLMGGMHGYEKVTSIFYYGDGIKFIPTENLINSFNKLEIVETSNLLNPKHNSQTVAKTVTKYIWNGASLTIDTKYSWLVNAKIITAYAAMFPTKNSKNTAYRGQIVGENVQNFHKENDLRTNSAKGTVWDNNNNLHMSMEVLNPISALNSYKTNGNSKHGKTWYRQFGSYIKLYITRVHSPQYEIVTKKQFGTLKPYTTYGM